MAKTHPHIDFPTDEQLHAVAIEKPQGIIDTYVALHNLVLDALPHVVNSVDEVDGMIGYGAHQYGYNGWGLASVSPHPKWVTMNIMAGPRLRDPEHLLQGTSKHMRNIKVSTLEEVDAKRAAITALVLEAATINS